MKNLKHVMQQVFFNEKMLRKRFKIDQPHSLRVRTYIIRGLNVSGALWQRLEPIKILSFLPPCKLPKDC